MSQSNAVEAPKSFSDVADSLFNALVQLMGLATINIDTATKVSQTANNISTIGVIKSKSWTELTTLEVNAEHSKLLAEIKAKK